MKAIRFVHKGNFSRSEKLFNVILDKKYLNALDKYGREGVEALRAATPRDTGLTASSWGYEISQTASDVRITFTNSNINKGINIAIILQYGHGTRNGGYVAGRDYINPAIRPVFDRLSDEAWKEVSDI